jgi:hypothetical protein
VFRSDEIQAVRTPFRAPQATALIERQVRTTRTECLDCLLVLNQQHLERILEVFVDHYNGPTAGMIRSPVEPRTPPSASVFSGVQFCVTFPNGRSRFNARDDVTSRLGSRWGTVDRSEGCAET